MILASYEVLAAVLLFVYWSEGGYKVEEKWLFSEAGWARGQTESPRCLTLDVDESTRATHSRGHLQGETARKREEVGTEGGR